ncbi:UNVERIFIED_CONTAM: hypothetical protein Sindi_0814700, partial [Sesamum indicum]
MSAPRPADNTFTPEYNQTRKYLKKDVDHCEEKSNSMLSEAGNVKGAGASAELHIWKTELESRDNGFEKPLDDKKSQITAPLEDPVPPVISELLNNIHVISNVVRVGSANIDGTGMELEDNIEVVASERTSELPISEESISQFTNSEMLREKSANDNSCIADAAEVSTELNRGGGVVELNENLENPTPIHYPYETSVDVEESCTSGEIKTSKSVGIVLSAEPASDGNVLASD